MIKCEDCGKLLRSRKAYAGHMLLAHGKRVGFMAEFDEKMREVSQMNARLNQLWCLIMASNITINQDEFKAQMKQIEAKQSANKSEANRCSLRRVKG